AEPVGVLPDRVLALHDVLDVVVAGDQRRRPAVPAHDTGAGPPALVHGVGPRDGGRVGAEERGDLLVPDVGVGRERHRPCSLSAHVGITTIPSAGASAGAAAVRGTSSRPTTAAISPTPLTTRA